MIIKTIKYQDLKEKDKEDIIKLMDVFLRPKGRESIKKEDVERAIKQENNTAVVACEEDKIIGIMTLVGMDLFTAKLGLIDEIVVDEAYQGKGVASKIMEEIIKIAREKKMDLLKVDTNIKNPSNHLYRKFGFIRRDDNLYKLFL
ncbi:MAG: GNAT family N-acetyltransferase [Nanoarchaeota archaeon]|nr:GNAT family N-acetyltransferase [Nanoarchaeota archaeon]